MSSSQGGGDALDDLIGGLRPLLRPNVDEWVEDPVTWVLRDDECSQSLYVVAAADGGFDVTVGEGAHTVLGLTRSELEPLVSLLGAETLFTATSGVLSRRRYVSLGDGTPVLLREAGALTGGRRIRLVPVPRRVDHIAALRAELAPLLRGSVTESVEHDRWRIRGRRWSQDMSIGYEGGGTVSLELGESSTEMVDFPKDDLPGVLERFDGSELSWVRSAVWGVPVSEGVVFADGHRAPSSRFRRALSRIAEEERHFVPRSDTGAG